MAVLLASATQTHDGTAYSEPPPAQSELRAAAVQAAVSATQELLSQAQQAQQSAAARRQELLTQPVEAAAHTEDAEPEGAVGSSRELALERNPAETDAATDQRRLAAEAATGQLRAQLQAAQHAAQFDEPHQLGGQHARQRQRAQVGRALSRHGVTPPL